MSIHFGNVQKACGTFHGSRAGSPSGLLLRDLYHIKPKQVEKQLISTFQTQ